MENKVITSKQYSLDWRDFAKGLLVSVGTAVLVIIQSSIDSGNWDFNWKQIGMAACGAIVVYLTKNFFQPSMTKTEIK